MWVFFQTLDPRIPKWRLRESLIGTNPGKELTKTLHVIQYSNHIQLFGFTGLGFRPMPPDENVESSLIYYRGTRHEDYRVWTDALDKFLAGMMRGTHTLSSIPPTRLF